MRNIGKASSIDWSIFVRANGDFVTSHYILHLFKYNSNRKFAINILSSERATCESLTKDIVCNSEVLIPSNFTLNAFDKSIDIIYYLQQALFQRNNALAQARPLLLPRLMTGEEAV